MFTKIFSQTVAAAFAAIAFFAFASPAFAGDTTQYAIFNPATFEDHIHDGGNIWNVSEKDNKDKKRLCKRLGTYDCILVVAPYLNWQAASDLALDLTGWSMERYGNNSGYADGADGHYDGGSCLKSPIHKRSEECHRGNGEHRHGRNVHSHQ